MQQRQHVMLLDAQHAVVMLMVALKRLLTLVSQALNIESNNPIKRSMKILLFFLITIMSFLFVNSAFADYRVFELVISNPQTKSERIVISSLDPFQYPGYYDLGAGEIVMYHDTWMCWGDSSYYKKYCEKPTPSQSPAQRKIASP